MSLAASAVNQRSAAACATGSAAFGGAAAGRPAPACRLGVLARPSDPRRASRGGDLVLERGALGAVGGVVAVEALSRRAPPAAGSEVGGDVPPK